MEMYCKQSFIGLFPYSLQKFKVCDQNKNTVGLKKKKVVAQEDRFYYSLWQAGCVYTEVYNVEIAEQFRYQEQFCSSPR